MIPPFLCIIMIQAHPLMRLPPVKIPDTFRLTVPLLLYPAFLK